MIKYIFMTEERSMEEALKNLLPKINDCFKNDAFFKIIPHDGKQDLEKSIPRKLRAWKDNKELQYKFIIIRDQDSGDYFKIKEKLKKMCSDAGRNDALIRIAIHELESWFLGDLPAIDSAFSLNLHKKAKEKKYRDPDKLGNPSEILSKILNNKSKMNWARNISEFMNINNNNSKSFNMFVTGVQSLITR